MLQFIIYIILHKCLVVGKKNARLPTKQIFIISLHLIIIIFGILKKIFLKHGDIQQ